MSGFASIIAAKKKAKLAEAAAKKAAAAEATEAGDASAHASTWSSDMNPPGAPPLPSSPGGGSSSPPILPTMGSGGPQGLPATNVASENAKRLLALPRKKKNLLSSLNRLDGVVRRSNTLVGAPPMVPGKLSFEELERGNDDPKQALLNKPSCPVGEGICTFCRAGEEKTTTCHCYQFIPPEGQESTWTNGSQCANCGHTATWHTGVLQKTENKLAQAENKIDAKKIDEETQKELDEIEVAFFWRFPADCFSE